MNLNDADCLIRNARIVTASEEFTGSMRVKNGIISDLTTQASVSTMTSSETSAETHSETHSESNFAGQLSCAQTEDWQGDYLIPGLVELHTDNLEKHLMPRPKVNWPVLPAILAHDAQIISAGITTVLDALAVGDIEPDSLRMQSLSLCSAALLEAQQAGLLRAEHYLHMRLELAEPELYTMFAPYLQDPRLRLVSLMDHTPGQRQWTDMHHYRVYMTGKRGWSEHKVDSMLERLLERQSLYVEQNRQKIIQACRLHNQPLPLAVHDDTTDEHVLQGVAEGITISEFPTTLQAAQTARAQGMKIIMGAPNRVRGASHSGNVAVSTLARADCLDVLSSDYVPASLLHAAFLLQEDGFSLPKAIATVTKNPASLIGLTDRGELATGLRADFLRVRMHGDIPLVVGVWKAGRKL